MYLRAGETYTDFAIVDNERKQPYRYRPNYSWTAPGFEVELGPGTYTVEVATGDFWPRRTGAFGMSWRIVPP